MRPEIDEVAGRAALEAFFESEMPWHVTADGERHRAHPLWAVKPEDTHVRTACGLILERAVQSVDAAPPPKCPHCERRGNLEAKR